MLFPHDTSYIRYIGIINPIHLIIYCDILIVL